MGCVIPPADAPVVSLTLIGAGESRLRMEKRLSCAAAGLGIRLDLTIYRETGDRPLSQTPVVMYENKVIFNGLPHTEAIEVWLKGLF